VPAALVSDRWPEALAGRSLSARESGPIGRSRAVRPSVEHIASPRQPGAAVICITSPCAPGGRSGAARDHAGTFESSRSAGTRPVRGKRRGRRGGVILVDPASLFAARGDGRLHVNLCRCGAGDASPGPISPWLDPRRRRWWTVAFPRASNIGDRVVGPRCEPLGCGHLDYVALDARRSR